MASGDTKTEALLNILGNGGDASDYRGCCNTKTQSYILDAIDRVQNVEDEVEELKNNPDVVDIVNTYADLQAYDKSTLTDKDIIRVLEDSTHNNKSTYYRYSASTDSFTYIGEAGSGVNVVQTTGTSTTDIMSQNAVTSMVFADPSIKRKIQIGTNSSTVSSDGISIGYSSYAGASSAQSCVAIGQSAIINGTKVGSVALGSNSGGNITKSGMVDIGSAFTSYGYEGNSNYRLLTGLHDPVNAHDAATKGYVDGLVGNIESALNAINNGTQS